MFLYRSKIDLISLFFFEILHFKKSCDLIGREHFGYTLRTRFFQIRSLWWNIDNNMTFNFRLLPGETDPKIFQCKKHHFWPILLIFGQKQNSKFCFYDCLFLILSVIVPSLKKTDRRVPSNTGFWWTYGQA